MSCDVTRGRSYTDTENLLLYIPLVELLGAFNLAYEFGYLCIIERNKQQVRFDMKFLFCELKLHGR